ncbi:hypothetical protein C8Q79DRAFT_251655 [Trametes meyenii]|nr:hypothetical protein C8Q79DRAFT_251655 [Trametes meyenii]
MNRQTPPHLDFEAMVQILTHPSCASNQDDPTYGNAVRLAEIGRKVLGGAYTDVICSGGPGNSRIVPETEILDAVDDSIENAIQEWATAYGWRARGADPSSQLDQAEENRRMFCAYVGAVFISPGGGYSVVRQWIAALIRGAQEPLTTQAPLSWHAGRTGHGNAMPPFSNGAWPHPSIHQPPPYAYAAGAQTHAAQGPLPGSPPPSAPAKPVSTYLPLLNQKMQQNHWEIQYIAQFSGPAHTGSWTAQCIINGDQKGVGTGSTKQVAKEWAAYEAYRAMGLAPAA